MESNKQERKNLVDDNPVAKEASALKNLNKGYGQEVKSSMAMMKSKKPSTAFAMKMSETKSALPMNMPDSPMKKALVGNQDRLPQGLQDAIKAAPDSPAKMYGGKKGDMSKSKKDYESPAKMYGGKKGDESKSRRDYESKTKSGPKDTDAYKKSIKASATDARISKLASNKGTSKAMTKGEAKEAKISARQNTRKANKIARQEMRKKNRAEKDPAKRMAEKVKTAKANEKARIAMRAKKRDIRKKAKG